MNSRSTFTLPDLGEGLSEAEIVNCFVSEGDRVVEGQPLLAVETDKAVIDIPSPQSAYIAQLHVTVGDHIAVGEPIVDFSEVEEPAPTSIVGSLPEAETVAHDLPGQTPAKASPRARRRAKELGIDITQIKPAGAAVHTEDVERAAHLTQLGTLSSVRQRMARRMSDAHARVVPATVTGEADVSAWSQDEDVLIRLITAVSRACVEVPELNAHFDDTHMTLTPLHSVNLGIATNTKDGLFVPVLKDAGNINPAELAEKVHNLTEAVDTRQIAAQDLSGQSITLSNFGAIAGLHAQMVVVPPQVAIIGAGRLFERVMADRAGSRIGHILPLSITIDHRVITGAQACLFLASLIKHLEHNQ